MKVLIKKILLNLNLYSVFERVYFLIKKFSYRKKNRKFLSQESGITIPPDFYMYETFNLDYEKFINGGKDVAK